MLQKNRASCRSTLNMVLSSILWRLMFSFLLNYAEENIELTQKEVTGTWRVISTVFSVLLNNCYVFPGIPLSIKNLTDEGSVETDPLQMFILLNQLGGKHGVGRIDIVENRFIGLKVGVQAFCQCV
jgi:hypothetical protein